MENQTLINSNDKPIIKHIVIAGGGVFGYIAYGVLKQSQINNYWKHENLKSIYGTSAGAIFAVLVALNFDWNTMDDYIMKRPWHRVFHFDMESLLNSIDKCGIMNIEVIEDVFKPLFKARDIPLDITLRGLYDVLGIEIHMMSTHLEDFKSIDISYKTHPDWKVTEAVYASCCLPILFSPLLKDGAYYLDGGVFCNYPLTECLQNGAEPSEILSIKNNMQSKIKMIDSNTNLFEYLLKLLLCITKIIRHPEIVIKNEVEIHYIVGFSIYSIYLAVSNIEERMKLIQRGQTEWITHSETKLR